MDADAFDGLVTNVLEKISLTWQEELSLEEIAVRLGVESVQYNSCGTYDGRIEFDDDRITIVVCNNLHPVRRRFTLAHEIGHLVLLQPGLRLAKARRDGGWQNDERFCNEFAASLLMPAWWIRVRVAHQPLGLAAIEMVSREREVSSSSVAIRLRRLFGWRGSLIRWRRLGVAKWEITDEQCVARRLHSQIEASQQIAGLLESHRSETGVASSAVQLPGTGRPLQVEILGGRRNALMTIA